MYQNFEKNSAFRLLGRDTKPVKRLYMSNQKKIRIKLYID
jgi:hypothetical protein